MSRSSYSFTRRGFLGTVAAGSLAWTVPGAFAEELARTPYQTEGPFYPDHLPLDTDNDLIIVNDDLTPAVGEITHLTGRILDADGDPIRNAVVEIWQCDSGGAYLHSRTGNRDNRDGNFQGFGRFLTGSTGEYYFRTIKPVPYPGRTPHIHFMVKRPKAAEVHHPVLHQGTPAERARLRLSRRRRRPVATDERVPADRGIVRRRTGGHVRYRAGPNARADLEVLRGRGGGSRMVDS